MKILIIDNKTRYLNELKALAGRYSSKLEIMPYDKIDFVKTQKFDLIILSGGKKMDVMGHLVELSKEIELIKKSKKSVLGICLGFEIIAVAFGAKLKKRIKRKKGVFKIELVGNDKMLGGEDFSAFAAHKWYLENLPKKLILLAKHKRDIQVFKHETKPIYAFQFHPEINARGNQGKKIFKNFIRMIKKKM